MIRITKHDKNWANDFLDLKEKIESILGSLAKSIDHIGSTAVPHLGSKDVIDIQSHPGSGRIDSGPFPRQGETLIAPGEAPAEPGVPYNIKSRPGRGARKLSGMSHHRR